MRRHHVHAEGTPREQSRYDLSVESVRTASAAPIETHDGHLGVQRPISGEVHMATRPSPFNGHKTLSNGEKRLRTAVPARRNGNGQQRHKVVAVPARSITSSFWKFFIGFIAGASLVFLPTFVTALAPHETESHLALFTTSRFSMGLIVAVFIAIMTSLQEYKKPARPWSIFMRALALPGLVIGSWQSLADNSRLREKDSELHASESLARDISGVREIEAGQQIQTPIVPTKTSSLTPTTSIQYASLLPVDVLRATRSLTPSAQERRFLIVVDRRADSTAAAVRAQELQATCCSRAAYVRERPGSGWYVLESAESRTHTEALRRAIDLRKDYPDLKLNPQLLAVEK